MLYKYQLAGFIYNHNLLMDLREFNWYLGNILYMMVDMVNGYDEWMKMMDQI